jgi:peptidoglycan/xylan/chitin deacetylase (PgdA/CDA1 family)
MKAGWELGAHTETHPDLTTLDAAGLQREIDDARTELQQRFAAPVDAFCYPAGKNDATVRDAVKAAGFRTATTVVGGIADGDDDPYALPRVRVNPDDTPKRLLKKIRAFGRGAVPAEGPQGYTYPASG